ncbi:hypothetical protein HanRHA438_Chr13g0589701 [Helianthus annuus]|nr:hypothetical protein HanRHA438_Chr13g0589701 [Helianthus annuus]
MIRVLVTHFTRDLGANCIIICANQSSGFFKFILCVFIFFSLSKSDFWLDLDLQFGIRAWYLNLGFKNLQVHH